jgi:hypothetical protein
MFPYKNEHLVAVPDVCNFCFGTGMEIVSGKGARRCRCRAEDRKAKLMEAALIPPRYSECSLQSYQPAKGNGSHQLCTIIQRVCIIRAIYSFRLNKWAKLTRRVLGVTKKALTKFNLTELQHRINHLKSHMLSHIVAV